MATLISRSDYVTRLNSQIGERVNLVTRLTEFATFDPESKPLIDAFIEANGKYVDQLKARGLEGVTLRPLQDEPLVNWARRFADGRLVIGLLEYAQEHDKALVPYLTAHREALEALRVHVKARVEKKP